MVFHNGSAYDYHFIIKQLAKEFDGQFECVAENTEKYITFTVTIKKELDNSKTITYKLKFTDSFSFMSTSLSSLVDNLSDGLHCDNCIDCKSSLDYMITLDNALHCFFVVWLTDERRLAFFPAGTIVRDPHHRESPTRREQGLNLRRT